MTPQQAQSAVASTVKYLKLIDGITAVRLEEALKVLLPPAQSELCFLDEAELRGRQRKKVFEALKQARDRGLTTMELNAVVISFGQRLFELTEEGIEWTKKREGKIFRYFLHERHW